VLIFNYSDVNAPGTHLNPKGSFGLHFEPIITLAVPFNPNTNGYFTNTHFGDSTIAGTPSCFVRYYYNNGSNEVPDTRHPYPPYTFSDCQGCPLLVTVNLTTSELPHPFTTQLILVASANFNFISPLLMLVLAFVAFLVAY